LLGTLSQKARDDLRRVLIRDQADRGPVVSRPDAPPQPRTGRTGTDIIDLLTMYSDARREMSWILGEIKARRS